MPKAIINPKKEAKTEIIVLRVTPSQKEAFKKYGGSKYLRKALKSVYGLRVT